MLQTFIDELNRENLCTHFVLPLMKLSKFSFISSNFVDSYLDPAGELIMVEIVEPALVPAFLYRIPGSKGLYTSRGKYYMVYTLPLKWKWNISLFMQGRYSGMTKEARAMIIRFSGLNHQERIGKQVLTDGKILALDKHPLLKLLWERELEIELDQGAELLSPPSERSYIDPMSLTFVHS